MGISRKIRYNHMKTEPQQTAYLLGFCQWVTKVKNTPIIIRFPFEKMVRENPSYSLIRLNMDEAVVPESFGERAIGIGGDMAKVITDIRGLV